MSVYNTDALTGPEAVRFADWLFATAQNINGLMECQKHNEADRLRHALRRFNRTIRAHASGAGWDVDILLGDALSVALAA